MLKFDANFAHIVILLIVHLAGLTFWGPPCRRPSHVQRSWVVGEVSRSFKVKARRANWRQRVTPPCGHLS